VKFAADIGRAAEGIIWKCSVTARVGCGGGTRYAPYKPRKIDMMDTPMSRNAKIRASNIVTL
jgi:hypothetical protein